MRTNHEERKYFKNYAREKRFEAIKLLGSVCVRCGFPDYRALQFDHINGGGSKDRRKKATNNNGAIARDVIESITKNLNKYQLLCANCNWIKRYENNENRK